MRRVLLALAGLALIAFGATGVEVPRERGSLGSRLLGPVRGVAASVQWLRFDSARAAGEFDLAYARGESALRLDPSVTDGWTALAHHLAFDRGAPGAAPHAERRVWLEAGLALLERGKGFAAEPRVLELTQGAFLAANAGYAPEDQVWPGGAEACLRAAAEHFRAAGAEELAEDALRALDEPR